MTESYTSPEREWLDGHVNLELGSVGVPSDRRATAPTLERIRALVEWLGSNLNRGGYCDEAVSELGFDEGRGVFGLLALGQYWEALEVFGLVVRALEGRADGRA